MNAAGSSRLGVWHSSASRLALLYLAILVAAVSGVLISLYLITQRAIAHEADLVVQTEGEALRDQFRFGGQLRLIEVLNRRADDWGRIGAVYLLVDRAGNKLAGNLSGWPDEVQRDGEWLQFELSAREGDTLVDHPVRASVIQLNGNRLLVGTDISDQNRVIVQQRTATLWGIGLTTLLAALAGWWYSRRVAARIREVATACDAIISGQLSRRLPADGTNDEFDELTSVVNRMLDRVDHQTAVMRTTFRSAAHDLRTPLQRARIRLEAGASRATSAPLRDAMVESVGDIDRVQRTLATLLQIAHAESGAVEQEQWQTLDLAALARELTELYLPAASERGMLLGVAADAPATIRGNRQLLAQLLANLLENALKFVPAGGRVDVSVANVSGRVMLQVSDNGPGIPASQRDEALLPFRQLEREGGQNDAAGSGLGLSLVAAVVHIHRGQMQLLDNSPGLTIRCEFPADGPGASG